MKILFGKSEFLRWFFFQTAIVLFEVTTSNQILILLSYDGFRYDYLDKYKEVLPTLTKIASDGVRADYMQNVYPTETFPNHYTLVTGLYPESHGIVANNMFDPVFNASFTMRTNDSRWWQEGEPIWVTSEKVGHKTGVCYWPGYDAIIRGYRPSYRPMKSRNVMLWKERVDLIIGWLSSTIPPVFICVHYGEPDRIGHKHGTDSVQMEHILSELDNNTWYFMARLKQLPIFERINVMFTSDHGMMNYRSKHVIDLDEYIDPELYTFWSTGSTALLLTNSSKASLEEVYQKLKKIERQTDGIKFYKKDDIPESYHYRKNRRIADIVGVLKPGFVLKIDDSPLLGNRTYGIHGYAASIPQMHPFFMAYGSAFKKQYKSGAIQIVDLYPLMCSILSIEPAPNNGSLTRIQHLLRSNHFFTNQTVAIVAISSTVATVIAVLAVYIVLKEKHARTWERRKSMYFKRRTTDSYKLLDNDGDDDDEEVIFSRIA